MEFIETKSIVSNYIKDNMWFAVDYNMNIYKGCCHGCIYCDSRSECYHIDNFDTVRAKKDAISIIYKELKSKKKSGVIGTGAMSDPYNPSEKKYELTRKALKEINRFNFGVAIATKSPLITRDIDILKEINEHSPVIAKITITTFDDELCKKIEPNVAPSSERFKAIRELSQNGIFAGILLLPILPFINDTEENIKNIINEAHKCGAKFIYSYGMGVTLRANQRDYYYEKIRELFPSENLVGKYIGTYGNPYEYGSVNHDKLVKIFKSECEKHGILYKMKDIVKAYKKDKEVQQISMF